MAYTAGILRKPLETGKDNKGRKQRSEWTLFLSGISIAA